MADSARGGSPESSLYKGFRIGLTHVASDSPKREPLLVRFFAVGSPLGLQEDLWEWAVYDDATELASDSEMSKPVALESAQFWIDANLPQPPAPL